MDAKLEVPKTAFNRGGHLLPSLWRKLYLIAFDTHYRQWKGMLPKLRLDIVANDFLILSSSYKCSGRVIQSGIIHTMNEVHTGHSFAVSPIRRDTGHISARYH